MSVTTKPTTTAMTSIAIASQKKRNNESPDRRRCATLPAVKSGPHWIRSRVLDPLTGQEVPRGERGILAHTDLGNYNSVTTILTEDVGVAVDGGFLLLGRAQGAQAKGCSMAVDEFLRAARA